MDRSSCTARRHGTYSAYRDGCRCDDAREDHRLYEKRLREKRNASRRVPAIGYIRMVQAMQAAGWPRWQQEKMAGLGKSTLKKIDHRALVRAETARRIDDLYRRIRHQEGPSLHSENRTWARGETGYPPPGAWVGRDIHDPCAQPDWIRPGDPDTVAAEQVARGEMCFADLRSEDERLHAYQLAVRGGVSQRSMQAGWKVSSRVITRLNKLERTP